MKLLILAATLFFSGLAQANDGSFIYVDILGVNPKSILPLAGTDKAVQVYGKDVTALANALPYNSIHEASHMSFVSNGWNLTIYCPKYYNRPTTGELRDDTMCEFWINRFSVLELVDIKEFSDSEEVFSAPAITNGTYDVLGINPNGVAKGVLFDVYGDNAYVLNDMLNGQTLKFQSKAYTMSIACVRDYQRPAGKFEWRSDYMCTFSLQ